MTPMTHLMTDNDDDDVYLARCSIRILTVSVLPAPDSPLTKMLWPTQRPPRGPERVATTAEPHTSHEWRWPTNADDHRVT